MLFSLLWVCSRVLSNFPSVLVSRHYYWEDEWDRGQSSAGRHLRAQHCIVEVLRGDL